MDKPTNDYRQAIEKLANEWIVSGLPSRQAVDQAAEDLLTLRDRLGIKGLWASSPLMVTATLDDGLGQGLTIIEKYARLIGIRLISLGLLQTPDAIVAACQHEKPDYLGMTVLQFDSEEEVLYIAQRLPPHTRIVAGGPVFTADPEFAERTGTHYAAKNVAFFLRFMLNDRY